MRGGEGGDGRAVRGVGRTARRAWRGRHLFIALLVQEVVQQCRLPGAEEAGEYCDRDLPARPSRLGVGVVVRGGRVPVLVPVLRVRVLVTAAALVGVGPTGAARTADLNVCYDT